MNVPVYPGEKLISPADEHLRYAGRIGGTAEAPFFIYPCSSVEMKVTGRTLRLALENHHSYFENRLGVMVNGVQHAVLLEKGEQIIDLIANNVRHIHVYSMNKPEVAAGILANISEMIK